MIISIKPRRILHDRCCFSEQAKDYLSKNCLIVINKNTMGFRVKVVDNYVAEARFYCRECIRELVDRL